MTSKMQSRIVVELDSISLEYKRRLSYFRTESFQALNSVSFDIYSGETIGLIGGNGSGKSTLLRILAGIFAPDGGEIRRKIENISLLSLSVGFDPELSGRDNAILGGMLLGANKKNALRALDEIVEFSELGEHINDPIKTYSSGMHARLSFSVALFMHAELLLIDEVLGVGDIQFQRKATQAMAEKITSDQSVVLVTHSPEAVESLCDRVVWLHKGQVMEVGTPDEVLAGYTAGAKDGLFHTNY